MGCGCGKKKFGARVLVEIQNHSALPAFLVGKSTRTAYGRRKNGDRIRVYGKDIEADADKYRRL